MGEVTVVVVGSDASDTVAQTKTSREFSVLPPVCPRVLPNRGLLKKVRWALDPSYLNLHGYVASLTDRERVISYLSEYDLVWILNSRVPSILQRWGWPHSHLDIDDVPSTYFRSHGGRGITYRLKARIYRVLAKRRELRFKRRFTTLSVCSDEDRTYLGAGDRIHVIPNGFERPASVPVAQPLAEEPRIGFIGLCSYPPNADGVRWFLRDVWPTVRQAVTGVRFRLIGKNAEHLVDSSHPDVDALGWVEDPAAEIGTWSVMAIPIRFGGGTRVKIADAFSRKCPVVSTSLGAFGYGVEDGRQLRLADMPEAFAAACIELVRDRGRAAAMAERAWSEFLQKWTWDVVAPRVWEAAEDCLRLSFGRESCSKMR